MPDTDKAQELTFGEKAVGLTFNPSGNTDVQKLKELFAEILDLLNKPADTQRDGFAGELDRLANDQVVLAQMATVKAVTWGL